jgi:hypothetical protein
VECPLLKVNVNSELIEHELAQLHGRIVVLVRPGYGQQSDSWTGGIQVISCCYPTRFHFVSNGGQATLFTADDVASIDTPIDDGVKEIAKIIRLKGPNDYKEAYQTAR